MVIALARSTKRPARLEAERRIRETKRLERIGFRLAGSIVLAARTAMIRAWESGSDPVIAVRDALAALAPALADGAVAGHLQGRVRATSVAIAAMAGRLTFAGYDAAIESLARRAAATPEEVADLELLYGNESVNVTRRMSGAIEKAVRETTDQLITEGATTRQGTAALRETMTRIGMTSRNPVLPETLFRTQTQLAYSAGQWNANQDPAIDQILWGYEYVAIDDDRVRPTHLALDGTTLPKDDPRWGTITPPNGFNCRCSLIEIFDEGTANPPEAVAVVEGEEVIPGPDPGFAFNPGTSFPDTIPKADV